MQRAQLARHRGHRHLQRCGNLPCLTVAGGDDLDHRKIRADFRHLATQQEHRLIVQHAAAIEHIRFDRLEDVAAVIEQLDVFRYAAGHRIPFHKLTHSQAGEELAVVPERNRGELYLGGATPIQRTVIGKHLRLHHGHQRAAKNDHDVGLGKDGVPDPLENGRELGIRQTQILEFVQHDHQTPAVASCLGGGVGDGGEHRLPTGQQGVAQEIVMQVIGNQ